MMNLRRTTTLIALFCLCFALPGHAQDGPKQPIPDLTKGEELTRTNERWVGPLGIHCGAWRQRQGANDETPFIRQLLVREVQAGSPADGVLEVGDAYMNP